MIFINSYTSGSTVPVGNAYADEVLADGPLASRGLVTPETFDGSGGVEIGTLADAQAMRDSNSYTLEAAVKLSSSNSQILISNTFCRLRFVSPTAGFEMMHDRQGNTPRYATISAADVGLAAFEEGVEYHVVGVRFGGNVEIYAQAVLSMGTSTSSIGEAVSAPCVAGSSLVGTLRSAIYQGRLSVSRIAAHYAALIS